MVPKLLRITAITTKKGFLLDISTKITPNLIQNPVRTIALTGRSFRKGKMLDKQLKKERTYAKNRLEALYKQIEGHQSKINKLQEQVQEVEDLLFEVETMLGEDK